MNPFNDSECFLNKYRCMKPRIALARLWRRHLSPQRRGIRMSRRMARMSWSRSGQRLQQTALLKMLFWRTSLTLYSFSLISYILYNFFCINNSIFIDWISATVQLKALNHSLLLWTPCNYIQIFWKCMPCLRSVIRNNMLNLLYTLHINVSCQTA